MIVDTSSFIDYFRNGTGSLLPTLAAQDAIVLSKVVRLELLKGTARADRKRLIYFLDGLVQLPEFSSPARVESTLLELHGRGLNLGLPDIFILADARSLDYSLLTLDKPLAKAAKVLGLRVLDE